MLRPPTEIYTHRKVLLAGAPDTWTLRIIMQGKLYPMGKLCLLKTNFWSRITCRTLLFLLCHRTEQNEATGWTTEFRFPAEEGIYSLRNRVQTGSGTHPASYPRGTGGIFLGNKEAEAETDLSHPSAEAKNARSYASTHPYVFMTWHLVKHRDKFT